MHIYIHLHAHTHLVHCKIKHSLGIKLTKMPNLGYTQNTNCFIFCVKRSSFLNLLVNKKAMVLLKANNKYNFNVAQSVQN